MKKCHACREKPIAMYVTSIQTLHFLSSPLVRAKAKVGLCSKCLRLVYIIPKVGKVTSATAMVIYRKRKRRKLRAA